MASLREGWRAPALIFEGWVGCSRLLGLRGQKKKFTGAVIEMREARSVMFAEIERGAFSSKKRTRDVGRSRPGIGGELPYSQEGKTLSLRRYRRGELYLGKEGGGKELKGILINR